MTNIEEVIDLLNGYVKLEEKIEVLTRTKGMSQDVLRESQDYRNFLKIGHEIEKYVLNGGEIIEIYKSVKNIVQEENSKLEKRVKDLRDNLLEDGSTP